MWMFSALFSVLASSAWAFPPLMPGLPVDFVLNEGAPMRVRWHDGREAMVARGIKPAISYPLSFEVTENTCTPVVGARCIQRLGLRVDTLALVWTRHPDPARVNQPVIRVYGDGPGMEFPLTNLTILGAGDRFLLPKLAGDLPTDEMSCDDFGWLPGGSVGRAPEHVHVARWENELMSRNPETEAMENRTIGGAHGVELERTAEGALRLERVDYFTGSGNTLILFQGDIAGLTLAQPDGSLCQVSLKANLADAQSSLGNYITSPPGSWVPYIHGSDELGQILGLSGLLYVLDTTPDGPIVEGKVK